MKAEPAPKGAVQETKTPLVRTTRMESAPVRTFFRQGAVSIGKEAGIVLLTLLGMAAGLVLGLIAFMWALIRGKRIVHAEGILCKAELIPLDADALSRAFGARFAGPALVRFSGAVRREGSAAKDTLGLALRMRLPRDEDGTPEVGDQDLVFGTFESFFSLFFGKGQEKVNARDYLANEYDTVAPWRLGEIGVVRLRMMPTNQLPLNRRGLRRDRLETAIAEGKAKLLLGYHPNDGATGPVTPIATLRLQSISPLPSQQLRISFRRTGRGVTAVGFRNGLRYVVYPIGEAARRLRGG